MGGIAGEQGPGFRGAKRAAGPAGGALPSVVPEVGHGERMPRRKGQGAEQVVEEGFAAGGEGPDGALVGRAINAERGCRLLRASVHDGDALIRERVSERKVGVRPFQTEVFERYGAEKGRGRRQRMNRRTDVVDKSR